MLCGEFYVYVDSAENSSISSLPNQGGGAENDGRCAITRFTGVFGADGTAPVKPASFSHSSWFTGSDPVILALGSRAVAARPGSPGPEPVRGKVDDRRECDPNPGAGVPDSLEPAHLRPGAAPGGFSRERKPGAGRAPHSADRGGHPTRLRGGRPPHAARRLGLPGAGRDRRHDFGRRPRGVCHLLRGSTRSGRRFGCSSWPSSCWLSSARSWC